jgi:glycosyltransferase involved in cell wall biosynthesis/polysaccharide pyruvyl transferase WcaK-like protein
MTEAESLLRQMSEDLPDSLLVHQRLRSLYERLGDDGARDRAQQQIARIRLARAPVPANAAAHEAGGDLACLIVDPIFRGSRLYYSAMLAEALSTLTPRRIQLLTRSQPQSDLYESYRGRLESVALEPSLSVPDDLWYGQVGSEVCRQIVARWLAAEPGTLTFLSGWNEVLPHLLPELQRAGRDFPLHVAGYEYAPQSLREAGKRDALARLGRLFLSVTIWVLDESVDTASLGIPGVRVRTMPDPIPHAEQSVTLQTARKERSSFVDQHVERGQTSLLAVGLQSSRKGLRDIIRAARVIAQERLPARILLSGQVAPGEEELTPQVQALSGVVATRNAYVSDDEILRTYNSCDIVLLPYAKDFSGSSGVFAHAMAFGKPVIGTDHGCVGWRIKQFGVGLSYPSNDVDSMMSAVRSVLGWPAATWDEYRQRCRAYHARNTYEATLDLIRAEVRAIAQGSRLNGSSSPYITAAAPAIADPRAASDDAYSFALDTVESIRQVCLLDTGVGSRNMGDHIIVDSIKEHLRQAFPSAIFVNIPTHEYLGPESLKLLDSSEVRLVCGTNLLASHMDEYKQWKIGGLEFAALRDLTLLGCGWWQYQEAPNRYTHLLLNRILSSRTIHSVRDSYTLEKLSALQSKSVVNTTCPTLWGLTPSHLQGVPGHKAKDVITTLTDYKADPTTDDFMLTHLARRYRTVYVWIQGTGDFNYLKRLGGAQSAAIRVVPATLEAYDQLLTSALDLDYVGTRLHAGVRALQKKRRALILAVDNRAREISADTQLPCLPRERATTDLEALIDKFSARDIRLPVQNINRWLGQFR